MKIFTIITIILGLILAYIAIHHTLKKMLLERKQKINKKRKNKNILKAIEEFLKKHEEDYNNNICPKKLDFNPDYNELAELVSIRFVEKIKEYKKALKNWHDRDGIIFKDIDKNALKNRIEELKNIYYKDKK